MIKTLIIVTVILGGAIAAGMWLSKLLFSAYEEVNDESDRSNR